MTSTDIHKVAQDFSALRRAYRSEAILRDALNTSSNTSLSFVESWAVVGDRFPHLKGFCGDLASVSPNTATVESDFSIIGWERDEHRQRLTNFSLEGILQCKQFAQLSQL